MKIKINCFLNQIKFEIHFKIFKKNFEIVSRYTCKLRVAGGFWWSVDANSHLGISKEAQRICLVCVYIYIYIYYFDGN
jgi:hypothetical protein